MLNWGKNLKKIFGLPLNLITGALFVLGTYFTARDIMFLGLPNWIWLTVGVTFFVIALSGMLFKLQTQIESGLKPEQHTSLFPSKKPQYNKKTIKEARLLIDQWISKSEELRNKIGPEKSYDIDIREKVASLYNEADRKIADLIPDYYEYFSSEIPQIDTIRYNYWLIPQAEEAKKIDRILYKLTKIRKCL